MGLSNIGSTPQYYWFVFYSGPFIIIFHYLVITCNEGQYMLTWTSAVQSTPNVVCYHLEITFGLLIASQERRKIRQYFSISLLFTFPPPPPPLSFYTMYIRMYVYRVFGWLTSLALRDTCLETPPLGKALVCSSIPLITMKWWVPLLSNPPSPPPHTLKMFITSLSVDARDIPTWCHNPLVADADFVLPLTHK